MSLADPEADIPLNAVEHDRRSTLPQASRGPDSHPDGNVIEDDVQHNVTSLAPVDGGFEAWAFLVGAFVIETVIWGIVNVYGIYLQEYLSDPKIASQPHALSVLPLVGTLSSGIIYCSSPFINVFLHRFPVHRRTAIFFGVALCSASLLGASFATTLLQLVLTQGVLYATGAALTYAPTISYMSEWFVQKRGTAGGVMNAGTALGGLFLPLMLPPLIKAHGAALTLRYLSLAIVIILLPVLPFVKPRLPQGRVHGPGPRTDNKVWLKDWRWWSLLVVSTIQSFGYFVPVIWLPTYAFALNASTSVSALAVALLNGASVIGRIGLGVLADRVSAWLIALCTLLASSLATFLFWGVAGNATAGVMVFGFSYGLLAAGWSSLWTAFVKPMTKNDPRLVTSLLGFLLFSRGLGNIISTPISTALSTGPSPSGARVRSGFDVDGGRFGSTIIYVGTCFAGAAALSLAVWVRERALLRRTAEA